MVYQEIYNVQHGMAFGALMAAFPFMTGLSAGSFTLSTFAYVFGKKEYKAVSKYAVFMALILLGMAVTLLFIDMTQPSRSYYTMMLGNVTSMFSWSAFLVGGYMAASAIYAYSIFSHRDGMAKMMGIICIPLALAVHADTGFVFGLTKGMPIWHTSLMPFLFLISALTSGIALIVFMVITKDTLFTKKEENKIDRNLVYGLGNMLILLIAIEFFLDMSDVTTMIFAGAEEVEAVKLWLIGPFSFSFLVVQLGIGGIIPVLLLSLPKISRTYIGQWVAALFIIIGTLAMRLNVVLGGQTIPKTEAGIVPYTHAIGFVGYTVPQEIAVIVTLFILGTGAYAFCIAYVPEIIEKVDAKLFGKREA